MTLHYNAGLGFGHRFRHQSGNQNQRQYGKHCATQAEMFAEEAEQRRPNQEGEIARGCHHADARR